MHAHAQNCDKAVAVGALSLAMDRRILVARGVHSTERVGTHAPAREEVGELSHGQRRRAEASRCLPADAVVLLHTMHTNLGIDRPILHDGPKGALPAGCASPSRGA
ncbi:MAG TPA: hypothetical protein VF550_03670 [Polyangia bacterium]